MIVTVADFTLERRKRIAALASVLTAVVGEHSIDQMTPLEVLAALEQVQSQFIKIGLQNEVEEAVEKTKEGQ